MTCLLEARTLRQVQQAGTLNPFGERERLVAAALATSVVLTLGAGILVPAAFAFDIGALAHPGSIVDKGPGVAHLLRWAALLDMVSYFPLAPVVVYVHHRLRSRNPALLTLLTAGGLAYVLIGSLAGVLLASVGPPLIEGYATASGAGREAARLLLEALGNSTLVGLWGILELIPLGLWFIGVGWLVWTEWRRFAALSVLVGVALLAASLRTALTGRSLVDIGGPLDFVILGASGLIFVWEIWLGVQLWRGSRYR